MAFPRVSKYRKIQDIPLEELRDICDKLAYGKQKKKVAAEHNIQLSSLWHWWRRYCAEYRRDKIVAMALLMHDDFQRNSPKWLYDMALVGLRAYHLMKMISYEIPQEVIDEYDAYCQSRGD